jgi:cytochrome oxidase Cu insertion factor (SCO1/SenC/PrrC family)
VDHSIFFYLVNKEGEFLEFFGKNLTAAEVSNKMVGALKKDLAISPMKA